VNEITSRLKAARLLVEQTEAGKLPPLPAIAGAVLLVWQALEWAYGIDR
jgi:hypothetical protein